MFREWINNYADKKGTDLIDKIDTDDIGLTISFKLAFLLHVSRLEHLLGSETVVDCENEEAKNKFSELFTIGWKQKQHGLEEMEKKMCVRCDEHFGMVRCSHSELTFGSDGPPTRR